MVKTVPALRDSGLSKLIVSINLSSLLYKDILRPELKSMGGKIAPFVQSPGQKFLWAYCLDL